MSMSDLAREAHDDALRDIEIDAPLVGLDTETGGFKYALNALISMTLIELLPDLTPKRQLELFILPEPDRSIEEGAIKFNGYSPALWAERGAIPLREAFERARDWLAECGGGRALAHNAPFDRGFVEHQEERLGIKLGLTGWECSCEYFRKATRPLGLSVPNHKLETLARLCGHWKPDFVRGAHGATEDALACAAGYRWLKEQLAAKQGKAVARG